MGMASYQKWTINMEMMKVGRGKASRQTNENEFYSEHDASVAAAAATASTWRQRGKK